MPKIEGLQNVLQSIRAMKKAYWETQPPEVWVGYTQSYAIYVHEVPAKHLVGKDHYLTDPARELSNSGVLGRMVARAMKGGVSCRVALLRAGLRVQRESQEQVPVDTSALKASAFTAQVQDVESAAAAANARAQAALKKYTEKRVKEMGKEAEAYIKGAGR